MHLLEIWRWDASASCDHTFLQSCQSSFNSSILSQRWSLSALATMLRGLLVKSRCVMDEVRSLERCLHIQYQFPDSADDPEFQQWVNPLIARLIPILLHPKAPRSLHENAAVSIGRIGLMHPVLVAPHLPEFAQAWCQALYEIRDNEEKDSAFRGLCTLVQTNPAGIAKVCLATLSCSCSRVDRTIFLQSLLWFCNAIVRWNNPSPELNAMFQQLLTGFRNHDVAGWQAQVASFPQAIQDRLATRYGV